jgi:hypothetical protein
MNGPKRPPRLLFICWENSNRSQMAEAFARMYGAERVEPYSARCSPGEAINPKAIAAMQELGYDLQQHHPKGLSEVPDVEYDVVVTMGCEDKCRAPTMMRMFPAPLFFFALDAAPWRTSMRRCGSCSRRSGRGAVRLYSTTIDVCTPRQRRSSPPLPPVSRTQPTARQWTAARSSSALSRRRKSAPRCWLAVSLRGCLRRVPPGGSGPARPRALALNQLVGLLGFRLGESSTTGQERCCWKGGS